MEYFNVPVMERKMGLVYFSIFFFASIMALTTEYSTKYSQLRPGWKVYWYFFFIFLLLTIGLRHSVGGDWGGYQRWFALAQEKNLFDLFTFSYDPSFSLINWTVARLGGSFYVVNFISTALFLWGFIKFVSRLERPWLALVVACPYLITVVSIGYSRQAIAIGLTMIGILSLNKGKNLNFIFWVFLAATFHRSAIILMPLAPIIFLSTKRFNPVYLLLLVTSIVALSYLILITINQKILHYINAEVSSSGAALRIAMNVFPAAIYLFFRKNFDLNRVEKKVLTYLSYSAFGLLIFLILLPSSTVVDRLALYWIPLQLFVFSYLPDALGKRGKRNKFWVYMIIIYSFSVLTVWFYFGKTSYAWIPYRFYPFELWNFYRHFIELF
jgi:hypothetical protein